MKSSNPQTRKLQSVNEELQSTNESWDPENCSRHEDVAQ